ncbi:MAG: hypothetical protein ACFB21_04070 [Opitutales bacterium]
MMIVLSRTPSLLAGSLACLALLGGCGTTSDHELLTQALRQGEITAVVALPETPLEAALNDAAENAELRTGAGRLADDILNAGVRAGTSEALDALRTELSGPFTRFLEQTLEAQLREVTSVNISEVRFQSYADGSPQPEELAKGVDQPFVLAMVPKFTMVDGFSTLRVDVATEVLAQSQGLAAVVGPQRLFSQNYTSEIVVYGGSGSIAQNLVTLSANGGASIEPAADDALDSIMRRLSSDLRTAASSAVRNVTLTGE